VASSDHPPPTPRKVEGSPASDRVRTITQGYPTGVDPSINKGGQNGAPKPDGRSAGSRKR
jgi:hypothetical protein